MDDCISTSSDPSSSQTASPSNDARTTRSSASFTRTPDPDLEKIASLAQKLHDSVKALKSSKNKANVTISLQELENIVSRAQQVALLTAASAAVVHRSRDDALSLQISDMSNRFSSRLDSLESQLDKTLHSVDPQRVQPPPPPSIPALEGTRHSSLYLADGNLVLAAGSGSGRTLFKAHQSVLAFQSPVFASMFTLPHPAEQRDMYDGAPFCEMQDAVEDIESLLKVLYNPSELPYKRLDPLTPLNVRRTLAMATKYEMEPLRERIILQLEADWPASLAEWDRLETEVRARRWEHSDNDDHLVDNLYFDERLPEPGAAIRLAMDWNIPKILPAAFYHLSRLTIDADWLLCHANKPRDDRMVLERTARWDLLEAGDLKLLLKLREITTGSSWISTTAKACHSPLDCKIWWERTYLEWDFSLDTLERMRKFVETRPALGLCKTCWSANKEGVQQRRLDLWDEICDCIEEYTK